MLIEELLEVLQKTLKWVLICTATNLLYTEGRHKTFIKARNSAVPSIPSLECTELGHAAT